MPEALPELPGAEQVFDEFPCGLLLTTPRGTILRVNQTFCNWVGVSAEELVQRRKLQDLFTVGGRIFHQTHWAPMLQMQGSLAEVKFDVMHRDGRKLPMLLNAIRRNAPGGVYDAVSLTIAEERHKYEQELLRARQRADEHALQERAAQEVLNVAQSRLLQVAQDRALFAEQMVGIVSHDLRNPLSAILTGTSVLGLGDDLTAMKAKALVRVVNSTQRARRLIDDLLDFTLARIGNGLPVSLRAVDLHALVARVVDELSQAFPGRALQHVAVGEGECLADPDRVAQLVGNLVGNAMAYGLAGAEVTVTSRLAGEGASVTVHNNGVPIPPALRASLFEPMVRGVAEGSATRNVGLGLFIVRAIALAHGGDVGVESSVADGTTFEFRFPALLPPA